MERSIIQISVGETFLYAVCDDGTLWVLPDGRPWKRVEGPPSDLEDE